MNRSVLLITFAGMLGLMAATEAMAQSARIQFQTNAYHFGRVSQGEVVDAKFVFTNVGNAMLEITEVRPGCGCTTAGEWDRQVAPGKTGVIPFQFNTASFSGPVIKTPTVICNDSSQPAIYLQIVGEIWRPVEVNPPYALFNVTSIHASNLVQTVHITNNLPTSIEITELKSSHTAFRPVLREIQRGKQYELDVHLVPPLPLGTAQGIITAKTTSPHLPVLSVTAMAVVQPPVTAFPAALTLQPGPLAAPFTASVRFFNNQTNGVSLSNPQVSISNVTVVLREEQPGRLFSAALQFPAGLELPPGAPAEFSIRTSHPDLAVIHVPITQLPRPPATAQPRPVVRLPVQPQGVRDARLVNRPPTEPPPLPPEVVLPGAPGPDK